MKYIYPAVFKIDEEDNNFVDVSFPDIIGAHTFGEDMDDAIGMAKDLLKTMIEQAPDQVFSPSDIKDVQKEFPDRQVIMIEVNI